MTYSDSAPPHLKEISPAYSLEALMLKLKFQYFGHLMQTADSLEKTLMLGKIEGRRRMESLIQWTWTWANSRRWWGTGKPGVLQSKGSQRVGYDLATEQQVTTEPTASSNGWNPGWWNVSELQGGHSWIHHTHVTGFPPAQLLLNILRPFVQSRMSDQSHVLGTHIGVTSESITEMNRVISSRTEKPKQDWGQLRNFLI